MFVYAVGREHPYREPCRRLVQLIERGKLEGDASVELVHEFAHVRLRRTAERERSAREARAVAALCRLHDLERRDLDLGLELVERHAALDVRDALHAATAFNRGISLILSADRDFDTIAELTRVDPADDAALADLMS